MNLDKINKMCVWIQDNYPEPKSYWTRMHTIIRNAQNTMFEILMMMCMDTVEREPEDIIEDMLLELCISEKRCTKIENKVIRQRCFMALFKLAEYLKKEV